MPPIIVGNCLLLAPISSGCAIDMMIGTLIGFTALIPVAGAYIGAGVGAFMILTVSPIQAVIFLVFVVILQQLEGNLIYPKVVGSSHEKTARRRTRSRGNRSGVECKLVREQNGFREFFDLAIFKALNRGANHRRRQRGKI